MLVLVLGTVRVAGAAGFVDAGPAKQSCVLAVLALNAGRPVSIEALVDSVWGDNPPRSCRDTLYQYLSRLRGLGLTVRRGGAGYLLDVPPDQVDLHRARSLAAEARSAADLTTAAQRYGQALDLWRETPLGGIGGDWAATTRDTLVREHMTLLGERFDAELALGRHADVVAELSTVVTAYPLAERLTGQLMLALVRCGRAAEALECFTQTRQRVRDQLGVEPGPALRELHEQILREDPTLLTAEPRGQTPRQMPADIATFAGRHAELTAMDRLAHAVDTPRAVVISAVSGTAGVGKTALAVHWAHRVADRFPDGQLYVNLRGFDPGGRVMDPSDAVRGFLDALDVPPTRIPSTLDGMAALYRSLLAGRRVLVVLDNARDADHVRPLLPGAATAMVVVTSRNQLTPLVAIDGAHPITLDLLSTEDAHGLLAGRLGEGRVTAEPAAAEAIITACARLPLALSIAAARAQQTGFPLAGLAAELDKAGTRLDALDAGDAASQVRAVFSWSYATLTAPSARLFRLLGLHPGPHIAHAAAASLVDQPVPETRRSLTELVRANLLVEHGPERLVFHDLLRAYATELGHTHDADDERRAAVGRMLDHYRQAAAAPPNAAWLDTELPNLLAAAGYAIEHGEPEYVLHLSSALRRHLRTRGLHSDAETLYQQALTAALTTGHRVGEVDALNGFGYIDRLRGRPQQAADRYERAVRTARAIDYGPGEVEALIGLARVHLWQGRYGEATDHFEQALSVARAIGSTSEEVDALAGLGHLLRMRGQHEQAADHYRHALRIARETGHQVGELTALSGLGHIHRWYGRYAEATDHFEQVLRIARANGHHSGELSALSILADIHRFHRRHELAGDYLDQLLELARSSGDRNFEYEAWQGRGRLRFQAGDPDAAVAHHERALALASEMGQPVDEARALDGLAHAHEARGERTQARTHWQRALDILTELGVDDTEDAEMTVETIRARLDRTSSPG